MQKCLNFREKHMNRDRIAIIDSGVHISHLKYKDEKIEGYSISFKNGEITRKEDFDDRVGHGTAVYDIIRTKNPSSKIVNIKVYDEEDELSLDELCQVLEYIYDRRDHEFYDLINISMGVTYVKTIKRINEICEKLTNIGMLIVSAFDNDGAVSFPAALDCVIGVDIDNKGLNVEHTEVFGGMVNVFWDKKNYKVPWVGPDFIIVSGTSFACAEITGLISLLLNTEEKWQPGKICENIIEQKKEERLLLPEIEVASVFPFNKETQVIARFEKILSFKIADYYAPRVSGLVGRKVCNVVLNCNNEKKIKDIEEIDWDAFDTIIIGHTDEMERITGRHYKEKLLTIACEKHKKVYAFDSIGMNEYAEEISKGYFFYPSVSERNLRKRFGKLYKIDCPIVSVVGTNSKQGKNTLQIELRNRLIEKGYKIGQLGTEPTALLFGMNDIFSCGYNSSIDLLPEQVICYVNQMLFDISNSDVDLILTGSQTALLGYNNDSVFDRPYIHRLFFEGVQSDAIIMCINEFDDIEYVEQSIKLAEGISGGKVIALACFPIVYEGTGRFFIKKKNAF